MFVFHICLQSFIRICRTGEIVWLYKEYVLCPCIFLICPNIQIFELFVLYHLSSLLNLQLDIEKFVYVINFGPW